MIDPVPEVQPLDIQPLAPPAPPRRNLFYRIFVGPRGVRAGWKVAIFFLLVGGITMCFVPIVKMMPEAGRGAPVPPGIAFVQELAGAAAVVIATWIMARWIDRKPFGYFGMPLRNALRSTFWTGAVVGLGALALQLEIMHLAGWFDFGTLQLHGAAIVTYGAAWAAVFFCVGITEEGVLRGYVQRVTTDGLSRLPRRLELLGLGADLLGRLRRRPSQQSRRKQVRHSNGFRRRPGHVLQPVAHRKPLVRHRQSRRVGLGRDVPLRHS